MRELALELDVSPSWIVKVEKYERRLDVLEYVRLCNCLKVELGKGLTKMKLAIKRK